MRFLPFHFLIAALVAIALIVVAKVLVAPRLLRAVLEAKRDSISWRDRVELRYQPLSTYVWMFAWCKLRMDRMFDELPAFLKELPTPKTALDLGCGFGIAGCSMLEWFPDLHITGIDPSSARARAASHVFADRGKAFQAAAPDFESPQLPDQFDLVLMLDMAHFLSDEALELTLRRVGDRLNSQGTLILRAPMLPERNGSIMWNIDRLRRSITRERAFYRTIEQLRTTISKSGFEITRSEQSGSSPELFWFIARKSIAASNAG